jgi:hypothetical protein
MKKKDEYFLSNCRNNQSLIVSFGGMALQFGLIPPFEFHNFLNSIDIETDSYFYIDRKKNWYFSGIYGISKSIKATVRYLNRKIAPYPKNYILFLGTSSGAYAALLFASLLGVQNVIAFAPQTNFAQLHRQPKTYWKKDKVYFDLKNIVPLINKFDIFYHPEMVDGIHGTNQTLHLKDRCKTRPFPADLKEMRDNGVLEQIIRDKMTWLKG